MHRVNTDVWVLFLNPGGCHSSMWVGRLSCVVVQLVGSSSLLGVWSVLLLILGFPVGRSLLVAVGVGVRVV